MLSSLKLLKLGHKTLRFRREDLETFARCWVPHWRDGPDSVLHGDQHRRLHRGPGRLAGVAVPGGCRRGPGRPVRLVLRCRRRDGHGRHHLRVGARARPAAGEPAEVAGGLPLPPRLGLFPPTTARPPPGPAHPFPPCPPPPPPPPDPPRRR